MGKEITVLFHIQPSAADDTRRIIIKNNNYPFTPQIGGVLDMPTMAGRVAPEATIRKVVYPSSGHLDLMMLRCYAVLRDNDFDTYYSWLAQRKKVAGLTEQWAGWSII